MASQSQINRHFHMIPPSDLFFADAPQTGDTGPGPNTVDGTLVHVCSRLEEGSQRIIFGGTVYTMTCTRTDDLTEWECTAPGGQWSALIVSQDTKLVNINKLDGELSWTAVRRDDGAVRTFATPIEAAVTMLRGLKFRLA